MRVIFDARHLQTVSRTRGIGRYSRNLLAALMRRAGADVRWTLLTLGTFPPSQEVAVHADADLIRVVRPKRPELAMLALDALMLPLEIGWRRADVYHSVQLGLPVAHRMRTVITVHDLAPLHWPEHYLRLPHARVGHMWQYALAQRADAIIAPSHATARDVIDRLGVHSRKVHVIAEAVDSGFAPPPRADAQRYARERWGVPSRYVLYVGQFDPRKNMEGVLRAFAAAAADDPELCLVIAGDLGKLARHLYDALARVAVPRERVIITGFVDDATLASLYAGAECLLHAALLEGFGLTPLESLAAGTPVVGYRAGAVEEVVGGAGILVDPSDADALADALRRYLSSPSLADDLRARTRTRAALFSWDEAAERTLEVYGSVV